MLTAVETSRGNIESDWVIIGAGPWAKSFWDMLELPNRIDIKDRQGEIHKGVKMWTYWCLEEGTLGVSPEYGMDNEGKMVVVQIRLQVESIEGFSGHSDRRQLVSYLSNLSPKPERIFLCHGEKSKIINLANYIENKTNVATIIPAVMETFRLL